MNKKILNIYTNNKKNHLFAVKGIRRISPDRRPDPSASKKKKKEPITPWSVVEFQFYAMLEVHGIPREMQDNPKYVNI